MSSKNGERPADSAGVVDEEGSVDKKLKKYILDARKQVMETESKLFIGSDLDPDVSLSPAQKVQKFGRTVKQFLRWIEPILTHDDIDSAETYYEEKEIGKVVLVPPDTAGYRFSLVANEQLSAEELRRVIGLPRGVQPPQLEVVEIEGLRNVIEMDTVQAKRWEVCVDRGGAPPNWEYVYPEARQIIPDSVYRDAMREAVAFLQDAGVGLDIQPDQGDAGFSYGDLTEEPPE